MAGRLEIPRPRQGLLQRAMTVWESCTGTFYLINHLPKGQFYLVKGYEYGEWRWIVLIDEDL